MTEFGLYIHAKDRHQALILATKLVNELKNIENPNEPISLSLELSTNGDENACTPLDTTATQ